MQKVRVVSVNSMRMPPHPRAGTSDDTQRRTRQGLDPVILNL